MREDEPLEAWLLHAKLRAERGATPYQQRAGGAALDQLAQALTPQPEGKLNYSRLPGTIGPYDQVALSAVETAEAQRLYLQVWERGGAGSSHVAAGLLQGIALGLQPASVPFWRQLLDLSRPRDQTTTRRRTLALAALALLAIVQDETAAYQAITEALAHPHEQVRALAAFYLARAYAIPRRTLPEQGATALVGQATGDPAFAPRFQARAALRTLGRPVPHDDPELVYFLKVQLRGDRAIRTLALLPHNTLAQLHYAIQRAFDWDADHLYSFFLSGDRDERHYAIHCRELDRDGGFSFWLALFPGAQDVAAQLVEPLDTQSAHVGALGLVPKHQFIYFFDYGDSHQFLVTVLGIEARADDGTYPRLIEAKGKAPRQYHAYEDEDDEGET